MLSYLVRFRQICVFLSELQLSSSSANYRNRFTDPGEYIKDINFVSDTSNCWYKRNLLILCVGITML